MSTATSDAALVSLIEQALGRHATVALRTSSAYATSHRLENAMIRFDDGSRLSVVVKHVGPDSLFGDATQVYRQVGDQLGTAFVETYVYEDLLRSLPAGPPLWLGTALDAEANAAWLVLEHVKGTELYQVADVDLWVSAAEWAGRLHAGTQNLESTGPLPEYTTEWYQHRFTQARRALADHSQATALLDRIERARPSLVRRLMAMPKTLVHGDFYASNVLVADERVCALDWERAALGPGLLDIAALGAGWDEEVAGLLLLGWRQGAQAVGAFEYLAKFQLPRDFDICRLVIALQWLGWASDWHPPAENDTDWLSELSSAAQRLRL